MRLDEHDRAAVAAAYARGESKRSIAKRLRVSERTVYYWLKDAPVPPPAAPYRAPKPANEVRPPPEGAEPVKPILEPLTGPAWDAVQKSVPEALSVLRMVMADPEASAAARVRAADLVLQLAGMTPRVAERRTTRQESSGLSEIDWSKLTPEEQDAALLALEKGRVVKGPA